MGKLAERLGDARRSGVYRVASTEALEEAVALNGFALTRVALDEASLTQCSIPELAAQDGQVLLFTGGEALLRGEPSGLAALIAELDAAAAQRREQALRFFAAFLDPAGRLDLAPLYNWTRISHGEEEPHGKEPIASGR